MVTVIKSSFTKKEIHAKLKEALETKGVNTHKYCGTISLKEDPLTIQKKLRDEWE